MGCNSRVCEPQRGLGQDFSEGGGGSLSVFQSLIVVCISAAQDSQRRESAVLGQKGAAVFQAQKVVGAFEEAYGVWVQNAQNFQGAAAGRGPGETAFDALPQQILVFRGTAGQIPGRPEKGGGVAALAAETEGVHRAQAGEQGHAAGGEVLGAARGKQGRDFQHQIRAAGQGGPCTQILGVDGRFAPLYKVAAHGDHAVIRAGQLLCPGDLILVAAVKWIVFCNDARHPHGRPSFFP